MPRRTSFRRIFGEPRGRIEIVPPAVEHAFFAPGNREGARRAIELPAGRPMLLFVGRMQSLKGPDVAIRALRASRCSDAVLVVMIGGASGPDGDVELERAHHLVTSWGSPGASSSSSHSPHHILSTYYRAADVVIVPSRSESFGLVALEAAACGVPVIASAVGGLRSLVTTVERACWSRGATPAASAPRSIGSWSTRSWRRR